MRRTNVFVGIILGGVASLGGCATVRGTAKVNIDQSSPQALAASFHDAVESKNFAAMLECMEPTKQPRYDDMLVAARGFWKKAVRLAGLMEERIGPQQAEEFLHMANENMLPSPFSAAVADGEVDWSEVRFKVKGDTASAVGFDGTTWFKAKRIDSKWYMTHEFEEVSFDKFAWFRARRFEMGAQVYDYFARGIRSGRINKDNVDEEVLGLKERPRERVARMAAIPRGPAVDGVSIRITTRAPAFRSDQRLRFRVDIEYETDGLVCWWRPRSIGPGHSYGLGENIIVEIDGKPIQQPDVKADAIFGNFTSEYAFSVSLPKDLKLPPGSHTIRYTIISRGGTYTHRDGRKIPIVNGNIVSNTLTFVIEE